jgi:hypothetical protein
LLHGKSTGGRWTVWEIRTVALIWHDSALSWAQKFSGLVIKALQSHEDWQVLSPADVALNPINDLKINNILFT